MEQLETNTRYYLRYTTSSPITCRRLCEFEDHDDEYEYGSPPSQVIASVLFSWGSAYQLSLHESIKTGPSGSWDSSLRGYQLYVQTTLGEQDVSNIDLLLFRKVFLVKTSQPKHRCETIRDFRE